MAVMIRKAALLSLMLAVLAGCATRVSLDASGRRQLLDGTVHAVSYESPSFSVVTAGRMATAGLLGPIAGVVVGIQAQNEGKEAVARLAMPDPAAQIRDRLTQRLAADGSLRDVRRAASSPRDDGFDDLRSAGLRPLVLDVKTIGWNLLYYGSNWGRYRVVYVGRARFLNVDAGSTLWEARCESKGPEDPAASPTLDEFRQPDGRVLREKIEAAISACVDELLAQLREG